MTVGQDALIEAMRLEQARIYGQLQHEHVSTPGVDDVVGNRPGSVCAQRGLKSADGAASNVTRLAPPRKDVA